MKFLFGLLIGLAIAAVAAGHLNELTEPAAYRAERPALHPEKFFNGEFDSWGVFRPLGGKAQERFTMHASASWTGDRGTMHEAFSFIDGQKKERLWTFTMIDPHHFIGTAPDVVGQATGEASGNSLHWIYTIVLPVHGHDVPVVFDDWLYLIDDAHMFSRVTVRKFGLPVGELTMFFQKPVK